MKPLPGRNRVAGLVSSSPTAATVCPITILFHKAFSRMARIQCEASDVLTIVSGLTAAVQYANMKSTTG